jgi:hypothetical protein
MIRKLKDNAVIPGLIFTVATAVFIIVLALIFLTKSEEVGGGEFETSSQNNAETGAVGMAAPFFVGSTDAGVLSQS